MFEFSKHSFFGDIIITPIEYDIEKKWAGSLRHPFRFKKEVVEKEDKRYGLNAMVSSKKQMKSEFSFFQKKGFDEKMLDTIIDKIEKNYGERI